MSRRRCVLFLGCVICALLASPGYTFEQEENSATISRKSTDTTDSSKNNNLNLKVGEASPSNRFPTFKPDDIKEEATSPPTSDVNPYEADSAVVEDKQPTGKNVTEKGMPPKYPVKVVSAEAFAHDNEISGCRDHPNAMAVCAKCRNRCFGPEHELYTYAFCRKSCRYCDMGTSTFHRYWRLRAGKSFDPTWMLAEIEFYFTKDNNVTLADDPSMAYASSEYPGYKASMAFDKDESTMWFPAGWGKHDNNDDWIAYEFKIAVRIHAVRVKGSRDHPRAAPNKVYVEAADSRQGPFKTKWTFVNENFLIDNVFSLTECPVLWHRFDVDDVPYCYRIIAKYQSWRDAQSGCALEGGELASISSKEESTFIVDDLGICGFTWIGLNDRALEGFFRWSDGSNTTYTHWKDGQSYDDVQRHYEDCTAMDLNGDWYTFSCRNMFFSVCKMKLEPRPLAIPEEPPYLAEIPPVIFMAPNYTVPVINKDDLEPGIMPGDEDAKPAQVEEKLDPEEILLANALQHLEQKGLKPPDDLAAMDEPPPEYEKTLSEIAENVTEGDFSNETFPNKQLPGLGQDDVEKKKNGEFAKPPPGKPVPGPNEYAPPDSLATNPNSTKLHQNQPKGMQDNVPPYAIDLKNPKKAPSGGAGRQDSPPQSTVFGGQRHGKNPPKIVDGRKVTANLNRGNYSTTEAKQGAPIILAKQTKKRAGKVKMNASEIEDKKDGKKHRKERKTEKTAKALAKERPPGTRNSKVKVRPPPAEEGDEEDDEESVGEAGEQYPPARSNSKSKSSNEKSINARQYTTDDWKKERNQGSTRQDVKRKPSLESTFRSPENEYSAGPANESGSGDEGNEADLDKAFDVITSDE